MVGEYGTGKTALTQVLLRRWLQDYTREPGGAIPFRIELKNFARQFDARGLLHFFLDSNELSAVPIEFVFRLIERGRVVLLLDGYDEMAQYMHARERRACLEALAALSKGGARGIITSRPNYFTEAEELRLLDSLYRSLVTPSDIASMDPVILERERELDSLLEQHFVERYERRLRDLDESQAQAWISRKLEGDEEGQRVVLSILEKIFRTTLSGDKLSLSGKPVIVSYLLEVVDELKSDNANGQAVDLPTVLSEWQAFNLIMRNLMIRDQRRAPELQPAQRRAFLQKLAARLSRLEVGVIDQDGFRRFVEREFGSRLKTLSAEVREQETDRLFADLRSSATLTRDPGAKGGGWRFSHNSLREFLAAEYLVDAMDQDDPSKVERFPVTDAMRSFCSSLSRESLAQFTRNLGSMRARSVTGEIVGRLLTLVWDAAGKVFGTDSSPAERLLQTVCGSPCDLHGLHLDRLDFSELGRVSSPCLRGANFTAATLSDIDFSGVDLSEASFGESILEGVSMQGANLEGADFRGALLADVEIGDAIVTGADFRGSGELYLLSANGRRMEGSYALGFLKFGGALTGKVAPIYVVMHDPRYEIAEKIARKLIQQRVRQVLGLTQRGVAQRDPVTARAFLEHLISNRLAEYVRGGVQIRVSEEGRDPLRAFCDGVDLDSRLAVFFDFEPS